MKVYTVCLPPEITYLTLWIGKTHSEGIDTFDIGVQYVRKGSHCDAFGWIFPVDSWTVFGICGSEKISKKLEMTSTTTNGPRGEFNLIFIRQNHYVGVNSFVRVEIRRTLTYKDNFGFDWIIPVDSLTVSHWLAKTAVLLRSRPEWRFAVTHSLLLKNIYEELDINKVCALNFSSLHFLIGKITTETLMHSFRVWYVQCLAKRLALNFIEFIQSKVWRSFDSLAVKDFMKNVCKIQRLSF